MSPVTVAGRRFAQAQHVPRHDRYRGRRRGRSQELPSGDSIRHGWCSFYFATWFPRPDRWSPYGCRRPSSARPQRLSAGDRRSTATPARPARTTGRCPTAWPARVLRRPRRTGEAVRQGTTSLRPRGSGQLGGQRGGELLALGLGAGPRGIGHQAVQGVAGLDALLSPGSPAICASFSTTAGPPAASSLQTCWAVA